jgi:hypothetical protein
MKKIRFEKLTIKETVHARGKGPGVLQSSYMLNALECSGDPISPLDPADCEPPAPPRVECAGRK